MDRRTRRMYDFICRNTENPVYEYENPGELSVEILIKQNILRERYGSFMLLAFEKHKVLFFHPENLEFVDSIIQEKMIKDIEIERFNVAVKSMKKYNNEIMCFSVIENQYEKTTWGDFLLQLEYWKNCPNQVELLKENIRTWRWGEQKYYRLTFTHPDFSLSRTEFAFGHNTKGLTYLVKKEDFKKYKKMLYAILN